MSEIEKRPNYIPLPQAVIPNQKIEFDHLEIPNELDASQFLVNTRALNWICKAAGFKEITVNGTDEEVGTVSQPSTAVTFPTQSKFFDYPKVAIAINNATMQEQAYVDANKDNKGHYDAKFLADYLDDTIKSDLVEASYQANFSFLKNYVTYIYYVMPTIADIVFKAPFHEWTVTNPQILGVSLVLNGLFVTLVEGARDGVIAKGESPIDIWKRYRKSSIAGCAIDRHLIMSGLVRTNKLITVKE